jgi:DNA-directed RNA polymerase specialized sigma24 family protein
LAFFYKTSSKETAKILVQETFLSAYRTTLKVKANPKHGFAILNNKLWDHYRLARTYKAAV